jgi:hypothetical protein
MRGGAMTYEEFMNKYANFDREIADLPMNADWQHQKIELMTKQQQLIAANPEHKERMFTEKRTMEAAEEEKKAAKAAAAAASQEKRRAENEIRIKDAKQRELLRNETATKFKQLFFGYKPKDPENELKDEDVKQKLLYLPAGPGDTYQLRIPEFAEMTDDKYKDLVELLNNLHNRGLFDTYIAIVKDLYGEGISFPYTNWSKISESDDSKKTNIFPNIKILNRLLGESQILRKTHERKIYDDERLSDSEFVRLEL